MPTKPSTVPPDEVSDNFSRAEMQKQIDDLRKQLEQITKDRDVVLEEQKAEIQKLKAGKSGWLITAPNALYDGTTMNVKFINGQAFIPDDRVFPDLQPRPLKDTEIAKLKPEQLKAIREREKVPTSVIAAQALASDFHYTVQHFDGEDDSLQGLMDARVKERAQLQALIDEQSAGSVKAAGLLQPNRFPGVSRG